MYMQNEQRCFIFGSVSVRNTDVVEIVRTGQTALESEPLIFGIVRGLILVKFFRTKYYFGTNLGS